MERDAQMLEQQREDRASIEQRFQSLSQLMEDRGLQWELR
jgi:hypothetical protein